MRIADGHRTRPCMAVEGHSSFFVLHSSFTCGAAARILTVIASIMRA